VKLTLTLTSADIGSLLSSFLPLQVRLAGDGNRYLELGPLRSFSIVPGVGLRVETSAHVHWEAIGIGIPLTVRALTALFRPHIGPGGTSLAFAITVEHADFVGVPGFVDQTIVDRVNQSLSRTSLAWDYRKTLGHPIKLSATLTPVSQLALDATAGELAVTGDGIIFSIDLDAAVSRDRTEEGEGKTVRSKDQKF
jgi:hypothetical protein